MSNIATKVKRLWLRRQYALCTAGGGTTFATLEEALQSEAFKRLDAVSGGLVASAAARDRSVSFSNSNHGSTTEDFAELSGEMLDLYEQADASLIASGIANPTDAQIFTEMLDRLQIIRETTSDYSLAVREMEVRLRGWLRNWLLKILNVRHSAAQWSTARTRIYGTPQDARLDIASCDRLTLVNLSRHWELNSPLAAKLGNIFEQYTVGEDGLPVSPATSDASFNKEALNYWQESELYLDIGNLQGFRNMQAVTAWRWFFDGEAFWIKTRGETGFPRLQLIETHRVATPSDLSKREDIIDGVQIDPRTGRPLFYYVADGADAKSFRRLDAAFVIPVQEHTRARLHRSLLSLAPALNDLQDLHELQHFEMLAAKDAAEITNVIYNQIGEAPADVASQEIASDNVTLNTGSNVTEQRSEYYRDKVGGRSVYLQIGDKLEQFKSDRPSVASQQFWDFLTSKICAGCGISKLLVYPWSMQGTVTRADLDSQAAFFRARSAVMIGAVRQAYEYVIGYGINAGRLKNAPKDWKKCSIRPPRSVNVDLGRNSNAMLSELAAGATNFERIYAPLGADWQEELKKLNQQLEFIEADCPAVAKFLKSAGGTKPEPQGEPFTA